MSVKDQPYPEIARQRIKSTLLIDKLQDHVLEGVEMNKTQVSAAIALLKKTVPDLQAITHQGPDGGAIPVMITPLDASI